MGFEKTIKIIAVSCITISFFFIGYIIHIYLSTFPHQYSTDINTWGQTGSFFGGIVGSLLAFITAILLIYSLVIQKRELFHEKRLQRTNSTYDICFRLLDRKDLILTSDNFLNMVLPDIKSFISNANKIINSKPSSKNAKDTFINEFYERFDSLKSIVEVKMLLSINLQVAKLINSSEINPEMKRFLKNYLLESLTSYEETLMEFFILDKNLTKNEISVINDFFTPSTKHFGTIQDEYNKQINLINTR